MSSTGQDNCRAIPICQFEVNPEEVSTEPINVEAWAREKAGTYLFMEGGEGQESVEHFVEIRLENWYRRPAYLGAFVLRVLQ